VEPTEGLLPSALLFSGSIVKPDDLAAAACFPVSPDT
jgi:hypothetical protein